MSLETELDFYKRQAKEKLATAIEAIELGQLYSAETLTAQASSALIMATRTRYALDLVRQAVG